METLYTLIKQSSTLIELSHYLSVYTVEVVYVV